MKDESIVQPFDFAAKYGKKLSLKGLETAVLCFSPAAARKLAEQIPGERVRALGACFDIYRDCGAAVVSQFGAGAPAAVMQLEHLKALGMKRFFSLGSAGAISPKLKLFQGVFIEAAYSSEGCSRHYGAASHSPSPLIKSPCLKEGRLLAARMNFLPARSWTTDAPYRGTKRQIENRRAQGAVCAEMEAAALMSAGAYHSLPVFCLAVISDIISGGQWHPHFSSRELGASMLSALKQLLQLD